MTEKETTTLHKNGGYLPNSSSMTQISYANAFGHDDLTER